MVFSLFRQTASDDELYYMLVSLLQTIRTASRGPEIFDDCVRNIQPYLEEKCKVDNRKLTRPQHEYVETVRRSCDAQLDELRTISDELSIALSSPDMPVWKQLFARLDRIFRPMDGAGGFEAMKRFASRV
jgi:hypothetical protein